MKTITMTFEEYDADLILAKEDALKQLPKLEERIEAVLQLGRFTTSDKWDQAIFNLNRTYNDLKSVKRPS